MRQDAATAEERALNRLYKHLPIGILKVTNDRFVMRITFANAYIEKITGLSMDEIVSREGLFIPTYAWSGAREGERKRGLIRLERARKTRAPGTCMLVGSCSQRRCASSSWPSSHRS